MSHLADLRKDYHLAGLSEKDLAREVPLLPFWGGYRLAPESVEFWQGRWDRLRDRRDPGAVWTIERLSP